MSIQLNHLTHVYNEGTTFEKVALNDVTLEIQTGEFIGLIGHTGSGKSTLIQHLNGIISPSSGEILLDGAPLGSIHARQMARQRAHGRVINRAVLVHRANRRADHAVQSFSIHYSIPFYRYCRKFSIRMKHW